MTGRAGTAKGALAAIAATCLLLPAAASAVPPGNNGRIAFAVGSSLQTMQPDGSAKALLRNAPAVPVGGGSTSTDSPSFSRGGSLLAFGDLITNAGGATGSSINTVRADVATGPALPVAGDTGTAFGGGTVLDAALSPDGTKVAYIRSTFPSNTALEVANADGSGAPQVLLPAAASSLAAPSFSPDGTRIVFTSAGDVLTMPTVGGPTVPIGNTTGTDFDPSFSPDGSTIIFARDITSNGRTDFLETASASGAAGLTQIPGVGPTPDPGDPTFSPDGTKIAYTTTGNGNPPHDIWVVPAAGGTSTNLTNEIADDAHAPDWIALVPATPATPPDTDKTAPDTSLTKPKKKIKKTKIKISFSATEAGSTFRCTIDKKAPTACTSPFTAKKLKPGKHKFSVTATDPAGNPDPAPAHASFKVIKK